MDINKDLINRMEGVLGTALSERGISNPDIRIEQSDYRDNIHVIVVSDSFSNMEQVDRESPIWDTLEQNFDKSEIVKISLLIAATPEEAEGQWGEVGDISHVIQGR